MKISPSINLFGKSIDFRIAKLILFVFSILLYANTLTHDYAVDDAIVIYDNMLTQEGVKGIPGILSNDTFYGFFKEKGKANLVSGGRYRPFTMVMFAIEWQIFGHNPFIGHLVNILLFGLLTVVVFSTIFWLLKDGRHSQYASIIAFFTALLFASHPIHTECVANIKGRDEIMAMLGAMGAFLYILKYIDKSNNKNLAGAALLFFMGLMSKENTITFLAVIPLGLILFKKQKIGTSILSTVPLLFATIIFLAIRTVVLGLDFGGAPMELMNNPFIKIVNNTYIPFDLSEKMATITFTIGKYFSLLFFPHPLTHDYYPRHIDLMSWSDLKVILSVVMIISSLVASLFFLKRNEIVTFSILYFFITLSIVSNVVFPIGTNMGERFLFMPSLGFCLLIGSSILLFKNKSWNWILVAAMVPFFAIKTVTRNPVWKNDFTLFTTDVKVSKRSAKLLNAAGGALSTEASKLQDGPKKTKMLKEANDYLLQATKIHPNYKNAYLLLGNVNYYLKDYPKAITHYDNALKIAPGYKEAKKNLGVSLRDAGRYYGEEKGELKTALGYLNRSYKMNPKDYETTRLLGVANGISGKVDVAIRYFKESIAISPNEAQGYVNLGTAYKNIGENELAQQQFDKALKIDPKSLNHLQK